MSFEKVIEVEVIKEVPIKGDTTVVTKEVIKDMIDKCNHIKKLPDNDIIKYISNNFHEDEITLMVY